MFANGCLWERGLSYTPSVVLHHTRCALDIERLGSLSSKLNKERKRKQVRFPEKEAGSVLTDGGNGSETVACRLRQRIDGQRFREVTDGALAIAALKFQRG